jgi:hypothetical protein
MCEPLRRPVDMWYFMPLGLPVPTRAYQASVSQDLPRFPTSIPYTVRTAVRYVFIIVRMHSKH